MAVARNDPRTRLRGRFRECAALDRMVATTRAGQSQVLVVRGEPGIGKSALVEYLVGQASGFRIARAAGVESEMELAYAGLHQLCASMLDRLDRLPQPQRDALGTAFGLGTGEPPDRFLVGLAVLSLLAEVAEQQPLVCVVDDAHWLDQVSAQTLAFVARRILAERIALVFVVREPSSAQDFAGLPELMVGGLSDPDARALLDTVMIGPVDEQVRDRIVAETRGNPLALLELPRRADVGGAGGWIRAARHDADRQPHRAGLHPAAATADRRDPTAPADGGIRTGRRRRRCCGARPSGSESDPPRRPRPRRAA